jgi:hypothetical protein
VSKLSPNGNLKVLHTFTRGSDGAGPLGLVRDAVGNIFGTTPSGGDLDCTVGGPPTWHAPSVPSYIEVGAPDAAVSAGRAEPTDHPYFGMFETNLLSARHADAGQ